MENGNDATATTKHENMCAVYSPTVFTEDQLVSKTDPFLQFGSWFQEALNCKAIEEATVVCVSMCSAAGRPSSPLEILLE